VFTLVLGTHARKLYYVFTLVLGTHARKLYYVFTLVLSFQCFLDRGSRVSDSTLFIYIYIYYTNMIL
jgi:hypothetical protein